MNYVRGFFGVLIVGLLAITGCREEGCIDPNALNFSNEAGSDDGSCTYEGDVVFWFDESYSAFILSLNVTELRFFVENEFVGSLEAASFLPSEPDCGDAGALTVTLSMGQFKDRTFIYRVENQEGAFLSEGQQPVRANDCRVRRID